MPRPKSNPVVAMPLAAKAIVAGLGALAAWEAGWWAKRRSNRTTVYQQALARARALGRPLVVLGAPDGGVTGGYGCGDITVDLAPSVCPNAIQLDVTKGLPFADDSTVVFASCILEYVDDYPAAIAELRRVAGRELYVVRVEPWTLTALFYPGAKRTIGA